MTREVLVIGPGLTIPVSEIDIRTSRASGPGGQHVNTSDSKVEVRFDVARSPSLPPDARERLLQNLGTRLSKDGVLRVVAQGRRSQWRNREDALARLETVLGRGLEQQAGRVPTAPSWAAKARRRRDKQLRSALKRSRGVDSDE